VARGWLAIVPGLTAGSATVALLLVVVVIAHARRRAAMAW